MLVIIIQYLASFYKVQDAPTSFLVATPVITKSFLTQGKRHRFPVTVQDNKFYLVPPHPEGAVQKAGRDERGDRTVKRLKDRAGYVGMVEIPVVDGKDDGIAKLRSVSLQPVVLLRE